MSNKFSQRPVSIIQFSTCVVEQQHSMVERKKIRQNMIQGNLNIQYVLISQSIQLHWIFKEILLELREPNLGYNYLSDMVIRKPLRPKPTHSLPGNTAYIYQYFAYKLKDGVSKKLDHTLSSSKIQVGWLKSKVDKIGICFCHSSNNFSFFSSWPS